MIRETAKVLAELKSQSPSSKQIPTTEVPKYMLIDFSLELGIPCILELGIWDFAPHLRLSIAAATIFPVMMKLLRRHRDWLMIVIAILAIPFIFYFVKTAGLRRDALRSVCSHL